jgi:hypothetical protein
VADTNERPFDADLRIIQRVLQHDGLADQIPINRDWLLTDEERGRRSPSFDSSGKMLPSELPLCVLLVRLVQASRMMTQFRRGEIREDLKVQILTAYGLSPKFPLRLALEHEEFPQLQFVSIAGQLMIPPRANASNPVSQTRLRAVVPV